MNSELTLSDRMGELLASQPMIRPVEIAKQLGVSEWEVVSQFSADEFTALPGRMAQPILESISDWGKVTTIIEVKGFVFEFKDAFPKGKLGFGYYNLQGSGGGLEGHLKLDAVTDIALLSRPLRGKETHAILFYAEDGTCIFKIYLGRDEEGCILPHQIAAFHALKEGQNVV